MSLVLSGRLPAYADWMLALWWNRFWGWCFLLSAAMSARPVHRWPGRVQLQSRADRWRRASPEPPGGRGRRWGRSSHSRRRCRRERCGFRVRRDPRQWLGRCHGRLQWPAQPVRGGFRGPVWRHVACPCV